MRIGVVRERKPGEGRVGLTPSGVAALRRDGHEVFVERRAGLAAGFNDGAYSEAGAELVERDHAWAVSELVLKVKEPVEDEYQFLRKDLTLFTYLHLAANRPLTEALIESGARAIAYETVTEADGRLPLLTPMSEIAGRLAAIAAAHYLTSPAGGPGTLIGGSPGVPGAEVAIVGGGVVGTHAALIAAGLQARVTILESSSRRVRQLADLLPRQITVVLSEEATVREFALMSDVVIGAVLVPGAVAPHVLGRSDLKLLRPDTLLIDVSIDQGGCFESSTPTTYESPTYRLDGVLHYCVGNMPAAVPRTATRALTATTLPYVRQLASCMTGGAAANGPLGKGLNVADGRIAHRAVSAAFPDLPGVFDPKARDHQ
jgi:alanine dehydrogenase